MAIIPREKRSLLSSQARVQAPWVKVTIGGFTFGVFSRTKANKTDVNDFYTTYNVQYPNYVKSLNIVKINGQVNQYTLQIDYPIRPNDDPNFFEKVFSSVSGTREIVFSYGDSAIPTYCYKDEKAIITKISQTFNLNSSVITYTINAVSGSIVGKVGNFTFTAPEEKVKPSDIIKDVFYNNKYGLRSLFTGMNESNFNRLVDGSDKKVKLNTKTNISPLDYISYLVGCMTPESSTTSMISDGMYVLTIHDDTIYDSSYNDDLVDGGAYFKVTFTSSKVEQSDAYEIDVGYNTANIVSNFSIQNNENYSIFYEYAFENYPEGYKQVIDNNGNVIKTYAPVWTSGNKNFTTRQNDIQWYSKLTNYPISASITIQGLLRPATLMQYVRLNVIFPGGNKHISSGLYLVTQQTDSISESGYKTTLNLTKISGDRLN